MADKPGTGPVEPLLEDLVRRLASNVEPGLDGIAPDADTMMKTLAEAATVSLSRGLSESSGFDRVLLAAALVPALTDALAAALERALIPEILKVLGQPGAPESPLREPVLRGVAGGRS